MSALELGYCTNVHAGATLALTRQNLERHALGVKARFSPTDPMGVGLWLSAAAAGELTASGGAPELGRWLAERGLVPFTLNGFPYGDFHEAVVKHRVYEPTWWEPARLQYTIELVNLLDQILPSGREGSISTLPIAWGMPCPDREELEQAALQLRLAAQQMHELHERTGRLIYLCIEPEPGCVFSFADDALHYFHWLLSDDNEDVVRRHIRLCHDVCHAAVMFEDQAEVLGKYRDAGIGVGKIQVSSALKLDLARLEMPAAGAAAQALAELERFAEDRYLHQTMVRSGDDELFYEDLPLALDDQRESAGGNPTTGEWRVHFHTPIYLREFGLLESTQDQILDCLSAAKTLTDCQHYEVETYAWGVLPPELQQTELAAGIAEEMAWLRAQLNPAPSA